MALTALWMCCRLDYPGVGPEHSFFKDIGRAEYVSITDEEALEGNESPPLDRLSAVVAEVAGSFLEAGQMCECLFCYWCCFPPTAFQRVSRLEGIIPALETSHALAYLEKLCPTLKDGTRVVLNFSGRGDKDVQSVMKYLNYS